MKIIKKILMPAKSKEQAIRSFHGCAAVAALIGLFLVGLGLSTGIWVSESHIAKFKALFFSSGFFFAFLAVGAFGSVELIKRDLY